MSNFSKNVVQFATKLSDLSKAWFLTILLLLFFAASVAYGQQPVYITERYVSSTGVPYEVYRKTSTEIETPKPTAKLITCIASVTNTCNRQVFWYKNGGGIQQAKETMEQQTVVFDCTATNTPIEAVEYIVNDVPVGEKETAVITVEKDGTILTSEIVAFLTRKLVRKIQVVPGATVKVIIR